MAATRVRKPAGRPALVSLRCLPARILPLMVALAVAATGCHPVTADGADVPPGGISARNATTAPLLPTDAYAMPSFDFSRYQALLAQLKGTPIVVNIWSSWCGPCRREAPELAQAARTHGDRIQFLGVDILDTRSAATAFMREFDWRYPSVFDPQGRIRDELGFVGQPDTLFVDADGRIESTWTGPLTPEALRRNLAAIL